jgi:peptidyl-tRNA hydrolase
VIWVNAALKMTVGKAAAQVGHASMLYAAARNLTAVPAFAVRDAEPDHWAYLLEQESSVCVRDAGFTEVAPGTVTCLAVDP